MSNRQGRNDDMRRQNKEGQRGYMIEKPSSSSSSPLSRDAAGDSQRIRKDGDFRRRGRSYSYDTDNNLNESGSKDRSRDGADYSYYRNPDDSQPRPPRSDSYDDYNCDDGGRRRPQPDPHLPRGYRDDDHHSFKPHERIDQERGRGQQRSRSQSVEHDDTDHRKGREIINKDDDENSARNQEQQKYKEPREWPPQFDEEPISFDFDSRSGMFWEPESQFFYDPKTKLYYSNRQGVYYRYDKNENPPFVEFQKVVPSESNQDATNVVSATTLDGNITAPSTAPGIKIAIKTKKLKRSSIQAKNDKEPSSQTVKVSSDQVTSTGTPSSSLSKEKQNIEKWSRQQQLRQKKEDGNVSPTQEEGATKTKPKVRTTAKGEPICLICKRKFPTLAKLELHENASQLHKQNLEKLKTEEKQKLEDSRKRPADAMSDAIVSKTATATTTYVDRAEKRRLMHHGTDPSSIKEILSRKIGSNAMPLPSDLTTTHNATTPIVPAGADLNSNNVGHKMLQKMGWKANKKGPSQPSGTGEVIASDSPASGDVSNKNNKNNNRDTTTTDRLRQDWDKIEAIARMNSRK